MAVTGDTLIDSVFDGRYRIVRKLGSGGMANVYLAEDQELGRRVAIKILNDRHAGDDSFIERFRREAKNAAGLSHPNIVSIYDRGEAEGTYYIAMEFLDGRSLKELIVGRGPTPIRIAIEYTLQILAAIGYAHRHGIVHRDIKPHNVVVDSEGRVKVTDFGIARSGASQMTEVGSIIGTAQYLSPEQARGAPVDQRSDVYSVGIVLFEMLTGKVPFSGDTPLEIAMKHLQEVPTPPSELRSEIPEDLDLIVLRALAKDPGDRYASAEEMSADLGRVAQGISVAPETADAATQVLSGAGIAAAPTVIQPRPVRVATTPPARTPPAAYYGYEGPPRRRWPLWPWILALVLLLLAGFAGWFLYTRIQHQLNANKPVPVPLVQGDHEALAINKLKKAHLKAGIQLGPDQNVPKGDVISQNPAGGARIAKDSVVTITVSTGKPRVPVPDVIGKSRDSAIAALAAVGLTANAVGVYSGKPADEITGQFPAAGARVVRGTSVQINYSRGLAPVTVPSVVGENVNVASGQLQGAGFVVSTKYVASTQPKNQVLTESPQGGSSAPRGSTVHLTVAQGPKSTAVPDVTGYSQADAVAALKSAGFAATVQTSDVADPSQDGVVVSESPVAGTQAPAGSTVTITVGHYVGPGAKQ